MFEITDEPMPIQSRHMHWGCNLVYLHHVFGKEILSEEALATIAAGVEFVNNQWPLVPVFIDSLGLNAVSTNDLLFQKSRCLLPSSVVYENQKNSHQSWKRIQALMNEFQRHSISNYLPTLQRSNADLRLGDLCLFRAECTARTFTSTIIIFKIYVSMNYLQSRRPFCRGGVYRYFRWIIN